MMKGSLEGLKVLDFSRYISGPYCAMMLADLGADVVKVEKINGGDDARIMPPMENGHSFYFSAVNRNKRSLCMDFRHPEIREVLKGLAKEADVIIENFRPGTIEKMGLGYEAVREINPKIILASVSGFGQDGPLAGKPGFDAIAQALSGFMSLTGEAGGSPLLTGCFVVDFSTGIYTAFGIMAALMARAKTGVGQVVNTTLLESAMSMMLSAIPDQVMHGVTMGRVGNRDRYSAPGNAFQTKDGQWVVLQAGASDAHFRKFAEVVGRSGLAEDPRFSTHGARRQHTQEVEAIVWEWSRSKTADEVQKAMDSAGLTCARVETIEELVNNPQVKHLGKLMMTDHPVMGKYPETTPAVTFSDMPFQLRYHSPELGQHTGEVLREWLGMSGGEIQRLAGEGGESKVKSLQEAVSWIEDGMRVAFGGFAIYQRPLAFVREIIRQGKKDLTVIGMQSSIEIDLLAAAGCIRAVETSYVGLEKYGLALNFRRKVQNGEIKVLEYPEFACWDRFRANREGLPFWAADYLGGSEIAKRNQTIKQFACPITGKPLWAIPAANADVAVVHSYAGDRYGNIKIKKRHMFPQSIDKAIVGGCDKVLVTVEKIIDTEDICKDPETTHILAFKTSCISEVPYGAHPTSALGCYGTDDAAFEEYVQAAKSPKEMEAYLARYVYNVADHEAYLKLVGRERLAGIQKEERK